MKTDLKVIKRSKELEMQVVQDTQTGEKFIVDKYPANQITRDSAHYAVSEEFGKFIGKTRTYAGAKDLIRERRKMKEMS